MTLDELRQYKEAILKLADEKGAYNVRVFGSVARGEATDTSDIDLLVCYRDGTTVWDAVALWDALQDLLGTDVSLVSEGIDDKPFIDDIMQDAVPL